LLGLNKLLEEAAKTGTMAKRSGSIESIGLTEYFFFLFCNIHIRKLDIIRKEYVVCLQIFSAIILPNIIKIGRHLTE